MSAGNPNSPSGGGLTVALRRWLDELSTQGILIVDRELVIRGWNHWLERRTGVPVEAAVGKALFELYPDLVSRGLDQYFSDALSGNVRVLSQRFHGYLLPIHALGSEHAPALMSQSASIAPLIEDDTIVGAVALIADVSDRVNSERRLRQEIAASERSRKTAEEALRLRDEFLTTLSHEMRTPLNAVLGWTRLLRGKGTHSEIVDRGLEVIDRNASAQARLIEDLLDMARIVSGKLKLQVATVDMGAVTRAAVDVIRQAAAAKDIEVGVDIEQELPPIPGDADRLLQVMWNLLSNAVKFTPAGGRVDVRVSSDTTAIVIVVRDSGEGIAPEFLPFIFERFRQQDASSARQGGLGIGLSLVRQLVDLHGGRIVAQSAGADHGSTFTLTLPIAGLALALPEVPASEATPLFGLRVLVVREAPEATLLQDALVAAGATAVSIDSPAAALTVMSAEPAQVPNVLVIDLALAGELAFSLAEDVRTLGAGKGGDVLLLAIAEQVGPEEEMRLMAAGFDGVVPESREPAHMVATIRRLAQAPGSR